MRISKMKKLISYLGKALDYIEEGLIVAGLAFMAIMNFANVVSRYFLHSSISYTEELVVIVFVWVTMLGISVGYKRKAHLGMSFITDHLPEKGKDAAILLAGVCSVILIGFMIRYGTEMVQNQIRFHGKTTALRLPTYFQGLAIPAGGVLMMIRSVQSTVRELADRHAGTKK